jgi:hypothetical protein
VSEARSDTSATLEEHRNSRQEERAHLVAVRDSLKELQALSDRVEDGDQNAATELRRALEKSSPEVIARCSNIARNYRRVVADTATGRDPLAREAIVERARRMAGEIAGQNPTPLETLLAERIASLWVLVEAQEALLFAWYSRENMGKTSPAFVIQMCRIQESTGRRYLAAIKTLAQVRKLQANTLALHLTQINVGERGAGS